jgi:ribosomal protein S3
MSMINLFFDGSEMIGVDAQFNGSKDSLGVSKIDMDQDPMNGNITVTFTLRRPGVLIGKAGRTIDSLKKYLSISSPVSIDIIEFNPWKV